mgnify:CR=1 FL=1
MAAVDVFEEEPVLGGQPSAARDGQRRSRRRTSATSSATGSSTSFSSASSTRSSPIDAGKPINVANPEALQRWRKHSHAEAGRRACELGDDRAGAGGCRSGAARRRVRPPRSPGIRISTRRRLAPGSALSEATRRSTSARKVAGSPEAAQVDRERQTVLRDAGCPSAVPSSARAMIGFDTARLVMSLDHQRRAPSPSARPPAAGSARSLGSVVGLPARSSAHPAWNRPARSFCA